MKVKLNGKWTKHRKPAPSVMHGFRCENVRLNRHDLRELAGLPDDELCARVRQISSRVNRFRPPYQREAIEALMKGKGFHTGGFVRKHKLRENEVPVPLSTPTGRAPSWPEFQYLPGTRTGRWSSKCPARAQEPRGPVPNEVKVTVPKTSGLGKSESALLGMDFSEIEKRVALHYGIDRAAMDRDAAKKRTSAFELSARQFGKAEAQRVREAYRTTFTPIWQECLDAAVREVIKDILDATQTAIDEEGCGAAMVAIKEWKE